MKAGGSERFYTDDESKAKLKLFNTNTFRRVKH